MSQITWQHSGTGAPPIETITGNTGGAVGPSASGNINFTGDNTTGITVVGTPGTNSLVISAADATESQKGVVELATNSEAIAGTASTNLAIIPSSLTAKLGAQTLDGIAYGLGSTAALGWTAAGTNGQLVIAATGAAPAFASLTSTAGTITITGGANTLNVDTSGISVVNYTGIVFADSPYTVLSTAYAIGANSTGGAITVRLPNAPSTGRMFVIKDLAGTAVANNITVTTVGGAVTIDGSTSFVMNSAYESVTVLFNGSSYLII